MTRKNFRISMLSFFYIALVLHGLQRISGLFIIELSKSKNISVQDAAIPFIYSWAVAKIVASFSVFFIDKKTSVFCGVLLCAVGAALCILDTAITVFWGFIFGSGCGLARRLGNTDSSNVPFFMELPSCFGILIMPILLSIFILQYGLQGSCIVFSGIILQYMPLALAAAYNIEIRIPNIKWRVRKKNSQYYVSKHERENAISTESFTNSLEPDFVLKHNQSDDYQKIKRGDPTFFSKEVVLPVGRKRSDTRGNDLQNLQMVRKTLHKHRIHHQTEPEREKCEKVLEESFSNADVTIECKTNKNMNVLSSEATHITATDTNMNTNKHDFHFKNKILKNISLNEIKGAETEKEELEGQCIGNSISTGQKILAHTCSESTKLLVIDFNKHENSENPKVKRNSIPSQQASEKVLDKETPVLLSQSLQSTVIFTIPLDIKVHVEEYAFTVDGKYRSFSEDKISNEINYSQSLFLREKECLNFANKNVSRNILHDLDNKFNLTNTPSISNAPKFHQKRNNEAIDPNINKDELKVKFIRILKFLIKIISPICLCIVVITIIFETTLITLLTNINNIENCTNFKYILVAFGIGGLFGKLCCFKISRTISEKSHPVGVVLFLLTGLSIAGVLYSPNMNWLATFYSILGALEGGISSLLPKFVLHYTHKDVHHVISSMNSFLSGAAIICLPTVIGLLSDETDSYEFLLQILSCLSVFCAFPVYFLPHLSSISNKSIPIFLKKNINS